MQFSTTTLITLLAGVGMAQFSQFPPCAQSCLENSATSCSKTNTACLCADQAYQAAAASCIEDTSGCSVSDEITALEVFEQLCNTSGTP